MPYFPSINKDERLSFVLAKFNTGVEKHLMLFHEVLMRGEDSPFSIAERELLAAYVSGVMDDCGYCVNIHKLVAIRFGIKDGLLESLVEDIDSADVEDKIKPVLHYVKKLTLHPGKMIQSDTDAVLNAGWSERALYDALMICCNWNFMNRLVEGLGLEVGQEGLRASSEMLAGGYVGIINKVGLK